MQNVSFVAIGKLGLIKYVMSLMNGARLGIAAQSVGVEQEAYNEAPRLVLRNVLSLARRLSPSLPYMTCSLA